MPEREQGPEFLKEKFDLHTSEEVDAAADRREQRDGESVGPMPDERIENYLSRLESIVNPPAREGGSIDRGERNVGMLRQALYSEFVIGPEDIPETYWQNQRRLIRERGQQADLDRADWDELKRQNTEAIIADQRSSLDNWLEYLTSDDAIYPDWLKYYAFRSVLSMGSYDKEKKEFSKRSKGTTAPFPDLNREALAYVLDAIEKRQGEQYQQREHRIRELKNEVKRLKGVSRSGGEVEEELGSAQEKLNSQISKQIELVSGGAEDGQQAKELVDRADFAGLYAWAIEKLTPASVEKLKDTRGEWVKYEQGSDHMPLVESIQGHSTGWCTAGEATAKTQLELGDFYVYYSLDEDDEPTVPRVAIRMEEGEIAEVRGIAEEQNLDPYIGEVVEEKLDQLPGGDKYRKKVEDMRRLTSIEEKVKNNQELNKDELKFLYEIDNEIEGFGYQRDPRIEEIRSQRDPKEDAPIFLDCKPEEIAWSREEIDEDTKAYIGPLFPGIFNELSDVEHIYTAFPERPIRRGELKIGGKSIQELEAELEKKGLTMFDLAQDMIGSDEFGTQANPEIFQTVLLKVGDFDFPNNPTLDELFAKARELGLEPCPAEVGLHQRLIDTDQPMENYYFIAMEPIIGSDGRPRIFNLEHSHNSGRWLGTSLVNLGHKWFAEDEFLFRIP